MKRTRIVLICCIFGFVWQGFAHSLDQGREIVFQAQDPVQTLAEGTDSVPPKPKYWFFSGMAGLNLSQVTFINWAAGGVNNANGRAFANLTLLFKKNRMAWDNNFDTEVGGMYTHASAYPWRKVSDRLQLTSKFGYEFSKTWFVTVLGSFKSQYANGYDYGLDAATNQETMTFSSQWLSPSYTDISVGIDWKPAPIFSLYYSPVAGRIVTCTDSILRKKYGVPEDKTFMASLGMTLKGHLDYSPIKNLRIISTLTLYTPYTAKELQPFGNIDVDWDFVISYQLLKVLNISAGFTLKYYDQVMIPNKDGKLAPRVQFKEVVGVGIGYSF
ncbi:MAG: DUF3078 domain-containing protein [Bacteroidales bacterium]|jgi:hypothetical protein|nr:DUF3078 domain-containing protein [Bacteroidales bacterium]